VNPCSNGAVAPGWDVRKVAGSTATPGHPARKQMAVHGRNRLTDRGRLLNKAAQSVRLKALDLPTDAGGGAHIISICIVGLGSTRNGSAEQIGGSARRWLAVTRSHSVIGAKCPPSVAGSTLRWTVRRAASIDDG